MVRISKLGETVCKESMALPTVIVRAFIQHLMFNCLLVNYELCNERIRSIEKYIERYVCQELHNIGGVVNSIFVTSVQADVNGFRVQMVIRKLPKVSPNAENPKNSCPREKCFREQTEMLVDCSAAVGTTGDCYDVR